MWKKCLRAVFSVAGMVGETVALIHSKQMEMFGT